MRNTAVERAFYLERCAACRGICDPGEWQRFAAGHLLEHIDDLWDSLWRRRQRPEHHSARLDHALAFRALAAVAALHNHPAREQTLAWLQERTSDPPAPATVELRRSSQQ